MVRQSRVNKGEASRELPTTTIITTILLLAASAWANSLGYYAAGQMLLIFAIIGGITAIIPIATDNRTIHIAVTFGSMFLAYIILQDIMVAGFDELIKLLFSSMIGMAPTTIITVP